MIRLPTDFKEFLRLLNAYEIEYLLVGGYAVSYYGYPRATADIDIWLAKNRTNADKVVEMLKAFGLGATNLTPEIFLQDDKILRMGIPPIRIELFTDLAGLAFDDCYPKRLIAEIDDVRVDLIDLNSLKLNKKVVGRHKDLDDLDHLP